MRFFCFFFLFINTIYGQQKYSASLKSAIYNNMLNTKNFDVLIKGNIKELIEKQKSLNIKIKYFVNDIACVSINLKSIQELIENNLVTYIEYIVQPKTVWPGLSDTMLVKNRIKQVKEGKLPLTKAYDGSGVIVGIIDTGIDIDHPDFKDVNGHSRIQFLWDQKTIKTKKSPAPFDYGKEWTNKTINNGWCTHKDAGHGTYVSGIVAGNGKADGKYEGCAPKADLIVVALDFERSGSTTADAVKYIVDKAMVLGKPFVINASFGNYFGSHDGKNLEAKLIDGLIANIPGRAMVAAAGNNGNVKFHTKTKVTIKDTNFVWLNNERDVIEYWLYADTANIKNVNYSIGVNRNNYEDIGRVKFKNYHDALVFVQNDTLKHNSKRIGIVQSCSSINPYGVYELYIKIIKDSLNYLWRIESTGKGLFDSWNFNFISRDLPSISKYPKMRNYIMPDTLSTIVSGLQCSEEIITVGNYVNTTNNKQPYEEKSGFIVASSSTGPTRNNKIKPDICATGNNIFSCKPISKLGKTSANNSISLNENDYYEIGGGTSAAAAVVSGWVALYLQENPLATNRMIREAVIRSAYSDKNTGSKLPNNKWGYGKLDGFKTFIYKTSK